jgi:glycine hydroxymethyltransferase
MADISHIAGLVASGHHSNPLPYCDVVTTTTHKTLRGPRGGLIMTNNIDLGKKFDKAVFPGTQGGPLEHVIAAKAVAFKEALDSDFKIYSGKVINNAKSLAEQLKKRDFRLVSDGTDNHLILIDTRSIRMSGKEADNLISTINITANKNTIPFDPESPFVTSGIRLGSPAMTTRGLGTEEFIEIGNIIADRLLNPEDEAVKQNCFHRVKTLCNKFPLYPDLNV